MILIVAWQKIECPIIYFEDVRLTLKNCSISRYFSLVYSRYAYESYKRNINHLRMHEEPSSFDISSWKKNSKMFSETVMIEIFRKPSLLDTEA